MNPINSHPIHSQMTTSENENDPFMVYERQLGYVKTLVNRNPEFLDVLDALEKALFQEYFLPDWEVEGHFARYYRKILQHKPELPAQANTLLKKFLACNHLSAEEGLVIR